MIPATRKLFEADAYLSEANAEVLAIEDGNVILDRTIFYANSGGQPGDMGVLETMDGKAVVVKNTTYTEDRLHILHNVAEGENSLSVGSKIVCRIDWERRYKLMQMHTALHLLCALVDAPVTGCAMTPETGRLDFDLPENTIDKANLTERLNKMINADVKLNVTWMDAELAAQARTISVAPPKGQSKVRIVSVPGVDTQPCGGTHIRSTGEIPPVAVTKIKNKGRINRRVSIAFV